MISALSVRVSKPILLLAAVANACLVALLLTLYNYDGARNMLYTSGAFKTIERHLDPLMYSSETFRKEGWHIEPGNVKFRFTNPLGKSGSSSQILEQNSAVYEAELEKEVTEPKDIDLTDLRPPDRAQLDQYQRANATIVALVRNQELSAIRRTIRKFEKSFNSKYHYPYTFINDEPFSQRFKDKIALTTDAPINFVVIPRELWEKPKFIDETREQEAMDIMAKNNIAYAKKESYHNMCRFYLGNMYNVPELKEYKYYWRIEPGVDFFTNLDYDVFKYLQRTEKIYGFTVNLYDIEDTVATLWPETINFLNQGDNYKYVNPNGAHQWLLEDKQNPKKNTVAGGYSTCHFWSNFEIGDMDFFRSPAYSEWFRYLDSTGKFYYERWGDAPVHSVGLALFADKKDIHWFRDIGYEHDPYYNCPKNPKTSRCRTGKFSRWRHLEDQNCMTNWLQLLMKGEDKVYFDQSS